MAFCALPWGWCYILSFYTHFPQHGNIEAHAFDCQQKQLCCKQNDYLYLFAYHMPPNNTHISCFGKEKWREKKDDFFRTLTSAAWAQHVWCWPEAGEVHSAPQHHSGSRWCFRTMILLFRTVTLKGLLCLGQLHGSEYMFQSQWGKMNFPT